MFDAFTYGPINRSSLRYRLERELPRNDDPCAGFAVVYVEDAESFAEGHIPLSIQIPRGREHEFERRFAKTKEIVLYGRGRSSWAVEVVALALVHRGFVRIYVYEDGFGDWCDGGGPVERGAIDVRASETIRAADVHRAEVRPPRQREPVARPAKSTSLRKNYTEAPRLAGP